MWQRPRLQLAQLDQQRGVHDVDVRRHGQLEQFSEDHLKGKKTGFTKTFSSRERDKKKKEKAANLHDVIVERDLIFPRITE